jgi:hypothetical protein
MKNDVFKLLEQSLILLARNSQIYGLDDPDEAVFNAYLDYCESEKIEPMEDILKALSISIKIPHEKRIIKLNVEAIICIKSQYISHKDINEIEKQIKIDEQWTLTSINLHNEPNTEISFIDKLLKKDILTKLEITIETLIEIDFDEDYIQHSIDLIKKHQVILAGDILQIRLFIECNGEHFGPFIQFE